MKSVNILRMLEANKENRNFHYLANRQNRVQSTLFLKEDFCQNGNIKPKIIRVQKWNKSQNQREISKKEDQRQISYELPRQRIEPYQHIQRNIKNRSLTNIQVSLLAQQTQGNVSVSLPTSNKCKTLDKFQTQEPKLNPQLVIPYQQEILEYLQQLNQQQQQQQQNNALSYNAFYTQSQITLKMRNVLINWLFEVHHKLKLRLETLLLTVWLIDKYIEKQPVEKKKFQLIGISCLFISAKYQEVYGVPKSGQLSKICDDVYSKDEILKTEGLILQTLNFNLSFISPLRIFEHVTQVDDQISYGFANGDPFQIVATIINIINKISNKQIEIVTFEIDNVVINKLTKELVQIWLMDDINQPFPSLLKKYQLSHYNHGSAINFSIDQFF